MPRGVAARGNFADMAAATEERQASCGFWALGGICNVAGARPKIYQFYSEDMILWRRSLRRSRWGRLSHCLGRGIAQLVARPLLPPTGAGGAGASNSERPFNI